MLNVALSLALSAALLSAAPGPWRPLGDYTPPRTAPGRPFIADIHAQPGLEVLLSGR